MSVKILIGADICPTYTNYNFFARADLSTLVGSELLSLLRSVDYTIFNLETPLTDKLSPIDKNGPCLIAPTNTINGLKAINPHFFALANNHILDQGVQGLKNTINLLKQAGISYAGVGDDLAHMLATHSVNLKGVKVGVYCCAEHEFSIATKNTPGANPYDPLTSFDEVRELKKQCDFVLVLYHGGKEQYRYPSPQLQRIFRKFAQCGANIVIAQHTHCVGCMETYQDAILVYGQGNFLFDAVDNEYWQTNLLVALDIDEQTKQFTINYIPCVKHSNGVRLSLAVQAKQILTDFKIRSEQIQEIGFIKKEYQSFANKLCNDYLQRCCGWLGHNLFIRILNKLTGYRLFTWIYSKRDLVCIQNILDCEAHRELFLRAVKDRVE